MSNAGLDNWKNDAEPIPGMECGHKPNRPPEVDAYCRIVDGSVAASVQIKVPAGYWNLIGLDREVAGALNLHVRYKPRYKFLAWDHSNAA